MNNNRQLAINMISQTLAFVVNFAISFFLTPFIVETVGKEAYGFVGLATNFTNYATIITTALNSMASRFITISIHQKKYDDANRYFTSVLISNIVISIPVTIASVLVLMFLDKIVNVPSNILGDVTALWALLFANFVISLIGNVFNIATFAQNRLELSSIRNIQASILRVVILVAAYFFFRPYVWYLGLATIICNVYNLLANMYFTKKLLPDIKVNKSYFDFSKIKELLSSGIWNSLSMLSGTLSTGLDLLITNLFVSAAAMGTVSLSKILPANILSVFGMLSSVFAPQLTISYAKNDMTDVKNQLVSSIRLLNFFACIPMAILYVFGKEFFMLWVPSQDAQLLWILSIVASMAFPFVLSLEPLWNIFTIANKVKQSSLFLIANSFATIAIVFVLLKYSTADTTKMYIIVGTSSVFSVIRAITFLPICGAKYLNFKWNTFYPTILKSLASTAMAVVAAFLVKQCITVNSWITLILAAGVSCIAVCLINFFLLLKHSERKIVLNMIRRL